MPLLKERAKTLINLIEGAEFIVAERPVPLDATVTKLVDREALQVLAKVLPVLESVGEWRTESIESAVKSFAEAEALKLGKIAQPLRAALTGRTTSPGIFDVLAILGRDESLARIGDLLLQGAVIREQQQPLRVVIQAPGRPETRGREIVGQRGPALVIAELAEYTKGFVEQDNTGHATFDRLGTNRPCSQKNAPAARESTAIVLHYAPLCQR